MIKGPSLFQPKEWKKKKRKERKWGLTQLERNSTQINWVVFIIIIFILQLYSASNQGT